MDLARVKYCVEHIDKHPESLTHCNGVDMAYFLPEDVCGLIAEVEALTAENTRIFAMLDAREQTIAELTALCDGYRGEIERLTNRLAEYKRDAQKYLRREDDLKTARDRAEKTVTELKARCKGYAVLLDGIVAELNTVPVDENNTDPAKSALFMIGAHIATFGDRPESVLDDSDDIARLSARVDELEGLAYSNGELYNKEYLRREAAESALTRARAEGMEEAAKVVDDACTKTLSAHKEGKDAYSRAIFRMVGTMLPSISAAIRAAKGEQ